MKKLILGLIITIAAFTSANASHQVAGDIGYECLGGNQYRFFVYFYRDCSGITPPSSLTLAGTRSCGNVSVPLTSVAFMF